MWQTIRKFGMEYCDLPTMLWNVTTLLRLIALDIDPRNKNPVGILRYAALILMCGCYYYVYLISMIWFAFVRCRETGKRLDGIIAISLGVVSEVGMVKLLCMFVYRKEVRQMITSFLDCDAQVSPTSRFAYNVKKALRTSKKNALIIWNVYIWNGVAYVFMPLLIYSERHFIEDNFEYIGFGDMENMLTTPYYEIAYTISGIGVGIIVYISANMSAFLITIVGYIEAQMWALSEEVKHLHEDAIKQCNGNRKVLSHLKNTKEHNDQHKSHITDCISTASSLKEDIDLDTSKLLASGNGTEQRIDKNYMQSAINEYLRLRLIDIVKSHITNINLLRQVEGNFRIAVAFEYLFITMAIIAELLGGLENTFIQLPFSIITVSIDCVIGQRIINAGKAFESAVYDSKWENFDVRNRKTILLMLVNSQKVMKLSAGGVATLSLECLMVVLKTTYSAYTAIRSNL